VGFGDLSWDRDCTECRGRGSQLARRFSLVGLPAWELDADFLALAATLLRHLVERREVLASSVDPAAFLWATRVPSCLRKSWAA